MNRKFVEKRPRFENVLSARIKRDHRRFASIPSREKALQATGRQILGHVDLRLQHDAEPRERPGVDDITVIDPQSCDHGKARGCAIRPAFASRNFRAAVPDLSVEVRKMIVADDYVTVHMTFKGHFTGAFGKTKGQGQPIDFIATDLLKITDGRITDNWHTRTT